MFHIFHNWKVIKLIKCIDNSWDSRKPLTIRIYKCQKCSKIKKDSFLNYLLGHDYEVSDFN